MDLNVLLQPIGKTRPPCKLGLIIDNIEDPYKAALTELVNDVDSVSSTRLSMHLKKAGLEVSENTILRHRRMTCACTRS
jgi:hypothetical protein